MAEDERKDARIEIRERYKSEGSVGEQLVGFAPGLPEPVEDRQGRLRRGWSQYRIGFEVVGRHAHMDAEPRKRRELPLRRIVLSGEWWRIRGRWDRSWSRGPARGGIGCGKSSTRAWGRRRRTVRRVCDFDSSWCRCSCCARPW